MAAASMTREEREKFLAETRVGLVSITDPVGGPFIVPVWYSYAPDRGIRFSTRAASRKGRLLASAGRAGFCAQSEEAPYRYVSIEGPVTIGPLDFDGHVRPTAIRYLGEDRGKAFLSSFYRGVDLGGHVLVTIQPERWRTVDYTKIPFFG